MRHPAALLVLLALLAGCASRRLVRHGQVNEDALETLRHRLVALRGLAFTTPVPVLALSREGIGSVVKDEIEQSYAPGDIEHAEAVYTRLGLLPPGTKLRPALEGLYQQEGAGFYDPRTKRLVVAESVPGAPSVGAGLLGFLTGRDLVSEFLVAHELTHVDQTTRGNVVTSLDCLNAEAEAYANQSAVWDALWAPGSPPSRTRMERAFTEIDAIYRQGGQPALFILIASDSGYQDQCRVGGPNGS